MKKDWIQFLKFLCFSIGAGVIELSSYALIVLLFPEMKSVATPVVVSVALSCLFNFTLNRKFTFKAMNNIYIGMICYGIFYALTTPLWIWAMDSVIASTNWDKIIVEIAKMLINFVIDFFFCKYILFRIGAKSNNSTDSKQ